MSKNKGFSDTSANRYSLALYELANESNSLSKIEENSNTLLKLISSSKDFSNLIKDPTVSRDILSQVINKISSNFKLEVLFQNFLNFLIIKRRFFYVEKILKDFVMICSKNRGEITAKLIVAKELNENEIKKIKDELSKNFGSEVKLNYSCDPDLIGGLIMQVESVMIDTSIRNKLQQIENKMIEA